MKSVTLRAASIVAAAALILAGCSSDPTTSTSTETSASPSESSTADTTSGSLTTSAGCTTTVSAPTETPAVSNDTTPEDLAKLDKVTVTGKAGEQPTVEFDGELSFSDLATKVAVEGTGDKIEAGQTISVQIYQVNADDGAESYNSYTAEPETLTLDPAQLNGTLLATFVGQQVGVRVLMGAPGVEADEASGTEAQPGSVAVVEVLSTASSLERADGTAVEPAAGLPTVALEASGAPVVTIPAGYTAPSELVTQVLIEGDGDTVQESDTITAHYSGWLFDCTQFDSSWERGSSTSFSLQGVIAGWTQGLAGQKVGSQVLLVIPSDLAYGESGQGDIPADAPLIFVVDILGIA